MYFTSLETVTVNLTRYVQIYQTIDDYLERYYNTKMYSELLNDKHCLNNQIDIIEKVSYQIK